MNDPTALQHAIGLLVAALAPGTENADQPAAEPITRDDLEAIIVRVDRLGERLEELLGGAIAAEHPAPPDDRPLYSVALLCERLNLSDRVVRQMLSDGVIPSFRAGGARRIDAEAVDEYLARRRAAEGGARGLVSAVASAARARVVLARP